jgi:hypothetical protein
MCEIWGWKFIKKSFGRNVVFVKSIPVVHQPAVLIQHLWTCTYVHPYAGNCRLAKDRFLYAVFAPGRKFHTWVRILYLGRTFYKWVRVSYQGRLFNILEIIFLPGWKIHIWVWNFIPGRAVSYLVRKFHTCFSYLGTKPGLYFKRTLYLQLLHQGANSTIAS